MKVNLVEKSGGNVLGHGKNKIHNWVYRIEINNINKCRRNNKL